VPNAWSKADLHIHSSESDGLATPEEIVDYVATRTDLKVIAITDHNTISGGLRARDAARDYPGLEVIVASEITCERGHVAGLFLTDDVAPGMSLGETIAAIEEQGGLVVIPHPFSAQGVFGPRGRRHFDNAVEAGIFGAVEVYNALPYLGWANGRVARLLGPTFGVAAMGGSDAHVLEAIGKGHTLFQGETAEDLRGSIERMETEARLDRGGARGALRYMMRYPKIRRQQALNWERCMVRY